VKKGYARWGREKSSNKQEGLETVDGPAACRLHARDSLIMWPAMRTEAHIASGENGSPCGQRWGRMLR
jgi:hypothetical protein